MKVRYIVTSLVTFLLMIPNVYARCSQGDIIRVKADANNLVIDKELVKNENDKLTGKYNITIKGLTEDIYIEESNLGLYKYNVTNNGVITLDNIEGGNYNFKIYYEICNNNMLRTIKYNLPLYNYYSESPLCEGVDPEIVKECGIWYQGELTEQKLQEKVFEYKQKLENEQQKEAQILNKIKDLILDYYIYIILIILIIAIIITTMAIRKKRYTLD